jgi:hypothetical protein
MFTCAYNRLKCPITPGKKGVDLESSNYKTGNKNTEVNNKPTCPKHRSCHLYVVPGRGGIRAGQEDAYDQRRQFEH